MPHDFPHHARHAYRAITDRPDFSWPGGKRLAVYIGLNLEHFAFGAGHGAVLVPGRDQPDVLNYAWRDYGNRVGAWRLLDLFEALHLPVGLITNSAIADYREFACMIIDQFDEMRAQSAAQPLVMGIALHPYIVGQPFRLRVLRQALEHIAAHREAIWLTTPGAIASHFAG